MKDINSPRKVFYASVKSEVCTSDEGDVFLDMLGDRNETSHTYNIEAARVVLSDVPRYYSAMIGVVLRFDLDNT